MRKVTTTLYRNKEICFNSYEELERFLWENKQYVVNITKVLIE